MLELLREYIPFPTFLCAFSIIHTTLYLCNHHFVILTVSFFKSFLCLSNTLSINSHIISSPFIYTPSLLQTGNALLVKTLLAFGANINEQGVNDFTPLDLAIHCQCSEVEKVLLEHGAKGSAKLIVQQQQQRPSVVGYRDTNMAPETDVIPLLSVSI